MNLDAMDRSEIIAALQDMTARAERAEKALADANRVAAMTQTGEVNPGLCLIPGCEAEGLAMTEYGAPMICDEHWSQILDLFEGA